MFRAAGLVLLCIMLVLRSFAADSDFPDRPNPPRLVNDFAGMMTGGQQAQLEEKLEEYARTTSTQITVVTIKSLGDYDVSDYAIKLGKKWGVGKAGKNNGVVVLASLNEHKINISVGQGLEGTLTDMLCGQIIRREMVPSFKAGDFYTGFNKASDAIIAATKGEYKADASDRGQGTHIPAAVIVLLIIVIYFILWLINKMRGGGGGNYMSGRGWGGFGAGWFLGSGFGGGWGGGGGSSGGGFGGFGGGDFGGGGASGSW